MENARKISSVYGYVMESIEKLLKQGGKAGARMKYERGKA